MRTLSSARMCDRDSKMFRNRTNDFMRVLELQTTAAKGRKQNKLDCAVILFTFTHMQANEGKHRYVKLLRAEAES